MNAIFSAPFAFFAFLAVPALVAIYLLRSKFRIHHVSSLMLWEDQKRARQGGLRINRIETPLLFLLELLTIILLVCAAAGPMVRSQEDARVMVIILDDSFSMLAGRAKTPRDRAIDEIKKLLRESGDFHLRFVLGGESPQLLGGTIRTMPQAKQALDNWKCLCPNADLNRAITLAAELAGKTARMLVVTDHRPENMPEQGRLEWWAFGKSLPNLAFVSASRESVNRKSRCFFAVANLSSTTAKTGLVVESLDSAKKFMQRQIEFNPNEIHRVFFESEDTSVPIRARLEADNLSIDNEIILLPEPKRSVYVRIDVGDEPLDEAVKKAVRSAGIAHLTPMQPHLLISDTPQTTSGAPDRWTVEIASDSNASAYLGPFVVDRSHAITQGLSLDGVIWATGKSKNFFGFPVVAAGNIPLVTDRESPAGSHNVRINLNPRLSNLTQSPNWPILIWNILRWRQQHLPGLPKSNFSLGSEVVFPVEADESSMTLVNPAGQAKEIPAPAGMALIVPSTPGLYTVKTAKTKHTFAVNTLSKSESDLTKAHAGQWGKWQHAGLYWWEYRSLDWLLLLIALALLTLHRVLTANRQKESRL